MVSPDNWRNKKQCCSSNKLFQLHALLFFLSPSLNRHLFRSSIRVFGEFDKGFEIKDFDHIVSERDRYIVLFGLDAMSAVNITNVTVLDNPASFLAPFQFEISYECVTSLKDDLEWKLIYVGSAEDETYDQLLESVLVGPVNVGNYRFVFQADPPDPSKIREEDIIGVTVLLLTCSYLGQEFVRVGYYVNNDYDDEKLREEPPQKVLIDKVQRNILTDKPRVTKFPINFHPKNNESGEQASPVNHTADADVIEEQLPSSVDQPAVKNLP